jgi:valyl-tRNA synthetase
MPACVRFDYEYAIRNNLPAHDVVDWDGTMKGQYQSKRPDEVRAEVIALLYTKGYIEGEGVPSSESVFVCKKGHTVCTIIRQTWFVRLDDERVSLRKNAVAAIHREQLKVFPRWREKGLVDWINKMHDWPIARQNAWGIRIPLWYEVTRPEDFLVWLRDDAGMRHHGSLATFLAQGRTIADIIPQLERVYAPEDCVWTHEPEAGKEYLPEMDMFDTWFSSGAWGTTVFGSSDITTLSPWYPSAMMVIGHDLLRLSVARKILLSTYMNGTLPFRSVYFHRLILASDGQKMSKSLGNAVPLDQYLSEYGADVTRMALVSYADEAEDFVFETEKLEFYAEFIQRAWRVARIYDTARTHGVDVRANVRGTEGDQLFMTSLDQLVRSVAHDLDKMLVTKAQERVVGQLEKFEVYTTNMLERGDIEVAASVFCATFEKYLRVLHPFAPHFTEEVWCAWDASPSPLAQEPWPTTSLVPRSH